MFLLDTNACIRLLNGTSPALSDRLRQVDPSEVCLCSVVKAELMYGARRSTRVAENSDLLRHFFLPFQSFAFDDPCADHCGRVRAELAARGTPIGPNDLLIAATALAHNLTLVTRNSREFSRVTGLRLEDWEG